MAGLCCAVVLVDVELVVVAHGGGLCCSYIATMVVLPLSVIDLTGFVLLSFFQWLHAMYTVGPVPLKFVTQGPQ